MRNYFQHMWLGQRRKTLRDFIRLVLAFYACMAVLSAYQFFRLYLDGVLPSIWNSSMITLLLHHSGFTALVSFVLAFIFQILERQRKLLGFGFSTGVFLVLLLLEGLLIEYYVRFYEILGVDFIQKLSERTSLADIILCLLLLIPITAAMMIFFYKINSSSYRILNKMYPFTIVLFTWFLATLISEKNPVNENKTQHMVASYVNKYLRTKTYKATVKYPLLKPYKLQRSLAERFDFKEHKPNIVLIIVDGLESEYLETSSPVRNIMPFLNSLSEQSLRWDNHISNAAGNASLSVILGSLPLAENDIIDSDTYINRNTLFSILAQNGYHTSFYFGGNSALGGVDKFLTQERVDELVDNKDFSTAYMPQRKDAAGISLGYPDKELFRNWNDRYRALQLPKLEVFYTLSMRKPSLIPELRSYRSRVSKVLDEADLDWSTRRDFWSNKDLLASMAYTDDALQTYFKNYCHNKPGFNNTLFVITGNREKESELENEMVTSTPVPLILYSPLLKRPETFNNLVSHTDITPGLLHILDAGFKINMPTHVAWTGSNLSPKVQHAGKEIPIYGANGTVKSLIKGKYLLGENKLYQQGKDRIWYKEENTGMQKNLIRLRSEIRLRNEYLIAENKILPEENTIFKYKMPDFSKREIAWINSVFNGKDYDAAYDKARELALSNNSKHSLLLCQYILANVPGHVDTEILMARIYGWQEHFGKAEAILERTIQKYPSYPSGYEALLDVCYWSNNNTRALEVARLAEANNVREKSVLERITRARNIANSDRLEQTVSVLPEKVRR